MNKINFLRVCIRNAQIALSLCVGNNDKKVNCNSCPFSMQHFGRTECVLERGDITSVALCSMTMYENIRYPDSCYNTLKGGDKNDET